jgi:predicted nucleic acid-binding OB-fold protein
MINVELDDEIIRLGYQIDIKSEAFITDELANLAHGQRRTGAHKKAVYISPDYVYKGPYFANLPGDTKKLLHNLYFTRALLILEEHLKIENDFRSIIDWNSIIKIENTNQYYLKQKSLGKLSDSEDDYELVTTKIETDVKVLRRGSHVHRLIELEKDQSDKQISQASVQHFYLRYLLNIGDSGTWNILVRRDDVKGICGIDFEEIRSEKVKKSNDPLMMIMSKVSKRQRDIYGSYTDLIQIFQNKIDLSDQLATILSTSFKIDVENMNKRIEDYAKCIRKKK